MFSKTKKLDSFWLNELVCLLIVDSWVDGWSLSPCLTQQPSYSLAQFCLIFFFLCSATQSKNCHNSLFFSFLLSYSDCYKQITGTRFITSLSKEFKMMVRWVKFLFHIHFPEHKKKPKYSIYIQRNLNIWNIQSNILQFVLVGVGHETGHSADHHL